MLDADTPPDTLVSAEKVPEIPEPREAEAPNLNAGGVKLALALVDNPAPVETTAPAETEALIEALAEIFGTARAELEGKRGDSIPLYIEVLRQSRCSSPASLLAFCTGLLSWLLAGWAGGLLPSLLPFADLLVGGEPLSPAPVDVKVGVC